MYYNSFQSSRAATILWGRLATCGRLAIGLPVARATLDERLRRLRLAAMWGRLATCGRLLIGLPRPARSPRPTAAGLRPAAMWGRLATCGRLLIGLPRPARNLPGRWLRVCGLPLCGAGWQNLRTIVKIGLPLPPEKLPVPTAVGLRPAAMWGRLAAAPSGSGRLAIGLPRPARNLPGRWLWQRRPLGPASFVQPRAVSGPRDAPEGTARVKALWGNTRTSKWQRYLLT
jgi:hypothetical protein